MSIKKALSLLAALTVCAAVCLSSCASDGAAAVSCKSSRITEGMYNFWASTAKGNFLSGLTGAKDTDEFWQSYYDGEKTCAQYLDALVREDVYNTAVCMMLYNEHRLSLSDEVKSKLKEEVDSLVREYAGGSKNALNSELSRFGINADMLYQIKLQEAKRTAVFNYLYGDGGQEALSDVQKEEYYKSNYVHFGMIYINDKYEYVTDENGKYKTDAEGSYVTRKQDEAKSAQKKHAAQELLRRLQAGEDITALSREYSELETYENGCYFNPKSSFISSELRSIAETAADTPVGDAVLAENEYGIYIIKRLETDDGAWNNKDNSDFFTDFSSSAAADAFGKYLRGYYGEITADDEIIKKLSVAAVNANYSF